MGVLFFFLYVFLFDGGILFISHQGRRRKGKEGDRVWLVDGARGVSRFCVRPFQTDFQLLVNTHLKCRQQQERRQQTEGLTVLFFFFFLAFVFVQLRHRQQVVRVVDSLDWRDALSYYLGTSGVTVTRWLICSHLRSHVLFSLASILNADGRVFFLIVWFQFELKKRSVSVGKRIGSHDGGRAC